MKFIKSRKQYEASNVTFNVETEEARSYRWWIFVKRIDGKLVFNNYGYSNSTRKHQSKVRSLLRDLGKSIDLVIEAPNGLDRLEDAKAHYERKIESLFAAINKKGSKKAKNEERLKEIAAFKTKMEQIDLLIHGSPLVAAMA